MKSALIALSAFMRNSIATMIQYRGEIVLWAVWGVIYPAVAMAMWGAAVKGSASGDIKGMGPHDFAAYFLLTMIVGHLSAAWDIFEMGWQVRTGAMSPRLLQPVLPLWQNLADNLAYKIVTLVLLVPIWVIVAWIVHPRFTCSPGQFLCGVIAALLAAALHFLWNYIMALSAFWVTRTDSLAGLWWGANLMFGGRLAPLEIMPIPLQWIAKLMPFQWIIWFPSAALAGQLKWSQIVTGFAWQIGWLVFGVAAFRVAWQFSIKRYSAVGA